jgi:hypothetical protein
MKKFFQYFAATALLFASLVLPAHAQIGQFSLLPQAATTTNCQTLMDQFEASSDQPTMIKTQMADVLGCAIETGRVTFSMVPYFISYITNFLISLSGIICVLFIVLGGYQYVVGGMTDKKEEGKNTIKHALMGLGVTLLAWTIVTVLINAVTG